MTYFTECLNNCNFS